MMNTISKERESDLLFVSESNTIYDLNALACISSVLSYSISKQKGPGHRTRAQLLAIRDVRRQATVDLEAMMDGSWDNYTSAPHNPS